MIQRYKYKIFFLLIILIVPFCTNAYTVEKYNDSVENKFIVTPTSIELNLKKGQQVNKQITLINRLGRREKFIIDKEILIHRNNQNSPDKNYFSAQGLGWIETEINEITLDHGERVKFDVQVNVPAQADVGGYYAVVVVSAKSSAAGKKGDNQINFISRIASPILITIPVNIREIARINEFEADKKIYYFGERLLALKNFLAIDKKLYLTGPIVFYLDFENLGNVHLDPESEITIENWLGFKVAQIKVKDSIVLPGEIGRWEANWNEKWLIGKYTATLQTHYGQENKLIKKTASFWVFPLHILILIVFLIIAIYFIAKKVGKKYEVKKISNVKSKKSP